MTYFLYSAPYSHMIPKEVMEEAVVKLEGQTLSLVDYTTDKLVGYTKKLTVDNDTLMVECEFYPGQYKLVLMLKKGDLEITQATLLNDKLCNFKVGSIKARQAAEEAAHNDEYAKVKANVRPLLDVEFLDRLFTVVNTLGWAVGDLIEATNIVEELHRIKGRKLPGKWSDQI